MNLLKGELNWNAAIRASLCLLPMVLAYILDYSALVVPLGQGGFFYSTISLAEKRLERVLYIFILLSFGMGLYLLGGNVVFEPWLSFVITFVLAVGVGLLSGGRLMAPLAFTFVTIYSAGLNVSNPDKLHANFLGFAGIFLWCGLISLYNGWKATDTSNIKIYKPVDNLKEGVRLGIGASLALFIANIFGFVKMGWPVSAVGSIIRFNETESKKRALSRVIGTVGGGILAIATFFFVTNPLYLIVIGFIYGVMHSLFSNTKLGKTVFFYTATILILYSINDLSMGPSMAIQRIVYNMVGVLVAIFVVFYSFPRLMDRVDTLVEDYYNKGIKAVSKK